VAPTRSRKQRRSSCSPRWRRLIFEPYEPRTLLSLLANIGTATDMVYTLPDAAGQVFLEDDETGGNGMLRLRSATGAFETTTFADPAGSLTINRSNAATTLTLNALPDLTAALTIGSPASRFAAITIDGSARLKAAVPLAIYARAITVSASFATTGGNATLNATDGILLNNSLTTDGGSVSLSADADGDGVGTLVVANTPMSVWKEQAKLTPPDGPVNHRFGTSVALSSDGTTAIVGDTRDWTKTGSAYVFTRSGDVWVQQAKLTASDSGQNDEFGISVALSSDGGTAIVGAWKDSYGSTTTQGSAYVFTRSGSAWTQQAKLTASDSSVADNFGISVALSGDGNIALVGAWKNNLFVTSQRGASYVYARSGSTWTQQAKLLAEDGAPGDHFGYSVALANDGNSAIIGASDDQIGSTLRQGSAYVFVRTGSIWTQQVKLIAGDGDIYDQFGSSVAISGDGSVAVVGSSWANSEAGAAYVFERSKNAWTQQAKFAADNPQIYDYFGRSVAVSNDGRTIIAGAFGDKVDPNYEQGSAYVFKRGDGGWRAHVMLTANDGAGFAKFGQSVALSSDGRLAMVGAAGSNIGETQDIGSSYTFKLNGNPVSVGSVSVDIKAADYVLSSPIANSGPIALSAEQANRAISIGADVPGSLSLSNQELAWLVSDAVRIGDATSGPITIGGDVTRTDRTDLYLTSGGAINFSGGSLMTAGGNLKISPGAAASMGVAKSGIDVDLGTTGALSFASGTNLAIAINGTAIDTGYQQLNVVGQVNLTSVNLVLSGSYAPVPSNRFTIINNDAADPIIGAFNGLAEGQVFNIASGPITGSYQITYLGGTGNDVVITALGPVGPDLSDLTFDGTPDNDTWLVKRDATTNSNVNISLNNVIIWSTDSSSLNTLTINGRDGSDTLTIDLSAGDVVPPSGIKYNGGDPDLNAGDKLIITGGDQGTVSYSYSDTCNHSGSVAMSNYGTIVYSGLESLANVTPVNDIIFNAPVGPSIINLRDDDKPGNSISRLSAFTFVQTDFANPKGTLTINIGNPQDYMNVLDTSDFCRFDDRFFPKTDRSSSVQQHAHLRA